LDSSFKRNFEHDKTLKVEFRLQNYLHFSSTKDPGTTQVAAVAHNVQRIGEVAVFGKLLLHFFAAVGCCFVDER
jgi:hypothetical protein